MWWSSSLGRLLQGSGNSCIKRCDSVWRDTGVPVITASLISVSLNRTAVCTFHTYPFKWYRAIMLQTFNQVEKEL